MRITNTTVKIKDLYDGFEDNGECGVYGFHGRLIIRPEYQREFVYNDKQQKEVIKTISESCPIGCVYWAKTGLKDNNGKDIYEVIDGQQRILSICNYMDGNFTDVHGYNIDNHRERESAFYDLINNYEIPVYIFEGTKEEKLEWFQRINIAGVKLTAQELRNAVFCGSFVSSAKLHFSKTNCAALTTIGKDFIKGVPIRQELLETVMEWKAYNDGLKDVDSYMSEHQTDENDSDLWIYYNKVMNWAKEHFNTRKGITDVQDWGYLYKEFKDTKLTKNVMEGYIKDLLTNDEITKPSGIIHYVLSGCDKKAERFLSIRTFDSKVKIKKLAEQEGKCAICGKEIDMSNSDGDHIIPWSQGGQTTYDNLQMLCTSCNIAKSNR